MNLIGKRFGRLTVIDRAGGGGHGKAITWKCQCACGNECFAPTDRLNSGKTKSCGCLQKDNLRIRQQTIHGDSKRGEYHRLYKIWVDMRNRCNNSKHKRFKDYGGRGIKICESWGSYSVFKQWALSNGYSNSLTIDRIDVNGNYEPGNCRWATYSEQNYNTRRQLEKRTRQDVNA